MDVTDLTNPKAVWMLQRLLRIAVTSWFLACALGIAGGVDLTILFAEFGTGDMAAPIGRAVLGGLALCVLLGWQRAPAALALALILFAASYMTLSTQIAAGQPGGVGAFWRDLALIAVLLVTRHAPNPDLSVTPDDLTDREAVIEPLVRGAVRDKVSQPRTVSRGSVQRAYRVNRSGRAVSRRLGEDEERRAADLTPTPG